MKGLARRNISDKQDNINRRITIRVNYRTTGHKVVEVWIIGWNELHKLNHAIDIILSRPSAHIPGQFVLISIFANFNIGGVSAYLGALPFSDLLRSSSAHQIDNMRGLTYFLKNKLYVALTNKCISVSPLGLRGPSFVLPPSANFHLLEEEPSSHDIFKAVDDAFEQGLIGVSSMDSDEISFAGIGEPLLRLDTLTDAATLILEQRHGAQLRVKTSGLILSKDSAKVKYSIRGFFRYRH